MVTFENFFYFLRGKLRYLSLAGVLLLLLLMVSVSFAATIIATIPFDSQAGVQAINPVTNRIYVNLGTGGDITTAVLDGATNATLATISYSKPYTGVVAVNPVTNRIYAASSAFVTLFVLDGTTYNVIAELTLDWPGLDLQ